MRIRPAVVLAPLALVCVCFALASRDAPADPPRPTSPPPSVVLLEGAPDGAETRVVLRAPTTAQPRVLGVVSHVAGSARRGTLDPTRPLRVYVVAAEREARHGGSYESALWRVDEGAPAVRLLGGLTDASRPLVTTRGSVLVQRGHDGDDPTPDGTHALRERIDALNLDRVDPDTGVARTVWSGRGMLAFLAAPLRDDEAAVYHAHEGGASLFALDARTGTTRTLVAAMEPMARDFSYDAARDELTFVRASPRHDGNWEIVSLAAHGDATPRVRWRATSDHLMPHALRGGALVFSLPDDRGLALLDAWPALPTRLAPLGDGADEVFAESDDGRWIALRHRTPGREVLGLFARAMQRAVTIDRPEVYAEFVGFVAEVSR